MVVKSFSWLKLSFWVGKMIGVCSRLASTQKLGSKPVRGVESAKGPDSPSSCGGALVVSLVPVNRSVIGVQGEQGEKQDEERPGVFSKAMV